MIEPVIVQREPQHPQGAQFLRDMVFGANDGVVTAIGFLVGIAGTIADQAVIVIAGILTIVAGSASMALGNFLAVKSQREHYEAMEKVERWEIENKPEDEKEEIREIYESMGFDRESVETLTKTVTKDKELWLKVMMRDELGLVPEVSPSIAGILIGLFYIFGGIPPLLPFIFIHPLTRALITSLFISIMVMAFIGSLRWFLNRGNFTSKVVETIIIGLVAAAIGFIAGEILRLLGISGVSV